MGRERQPAASEQVVGQRDKDQFPSGRIKHKATSPARADTGARPLPLLPGYHDPARLAQPFATNRSHQRA